MNLKSTLSKALVISGVAIGGTGAALFLVAARYQPTIQPHTKIGSVDVGGLSPDEAAKKIRVWWEGVKTQPLKLTWKAHPSISFPDMTPGQLGVVVDDKQSIAQVPLQTFWAATSAAITQSGPPPETFPLKYKLSGADPAALRAFVSEKVGPPRPAKVGWDGSQIVRKPEVAGVKVDVPGLPKAVGVAEDSGNPVELPIVSAPKHISDDQLAQITDLVSSYTTHFPSRQYSRNTNIRVAASKLNGVVLLPGERVSFNGTVGKRTVQGGFKEAPVYKNGKHDKGIGGGICQVSSTLYNASLLGNIKIVRHQNHSMPVAYVHIGRDATVDYGNIDLVLENNYPTPIAINSAFNAGTLTFRIFGKADPTLSVKIVTEGQEDWDEPVQYVTDPKLKPGQTVVIDKGSRGHRIRTYRLVYKNGKLVKREYLGQSYYRPATRVIARAPGAAPAVKPSGVAPAATPPVR